MKYDPKNDPFKPKIGSKFNFDGIECTAKEIEIVEVSSLIILLNTSILRGYDLVKVIDNPNIPSLKYLVWLNKN